MLAWEWVMITRRVYMDIQCVRLNVKRTRIFLGWTHHIPGGHGTYVVVKISLQPFSSPLGALTDYRVTGQILNSDHHVCASLQALQDKDMRHGISQ